MMQPSHITACGLTTGSANKGSSPGRGLTAATWVAVGAAPGGSWMYLLVSFWPVRASPLPTDEAELIASATDVVALMLLHMKWASWTLAACASRSAKRDDVVEHRGFRVRHHGVTLHWFVAELTAVAVTLVDLVASDGITHADVAELRTANPGEVPVLHVGPQYTLRPGCRIDSAGRVGGPALEQMWPPQRPVPLLRALRWLLCCRSAATIAAARVGGLDRVTCHRFLHLAEQNLDA